MSSNDLNDCFCAEGGAASSRRRDGGSRNLLLLLLLLPPRLAGASALPTGLQEGVQVEG